MSDEFGNWNELARLWHVHRESVSALEVERHAHRQRRQMLVVAVAEATSMALSFIAAVWIAMQTTMIALTAISVVFFALCGFLQHRLRREPPAAGGHDLLSSLRHRIEREEWNLAQFGIGRAVTFLTLFAIVIVTADHLRHYATTPLPRLWALMSVAFIVMLILALNLRLTWQARSRKSRVEGFVRQMSRGPEFPGGSGGSR